MDFETAIERVLGSEGGYTPGEGDPGGETNWGISKREYPQLDIKALTREDAKDLYRRDFWDAGKMGEFPDAVSYNVLDMAINSGIGNAIRTVQKAIDVVDDGHIGPVTLAAMKKMNPDALAKRFLSQRLRFMTKCAAWAVFGRGWANRIADLLDYSAEDIDGWKR